MYVASNGIRTAAVLYDPEPENPRDPNYQDNLGTMTCWHGRYSLGDRHSYKSGMDFLTDLAEKHVSYPEFFRFVRDGGVSGLRLTELHPMELGVSAGEPKYMLEYCGGDFDERHWESTGCLVSEDFQRISGPELTEYGLLEHLNGRELESLLATSDSLILKPLYLYDHSGITISTGSFVGRAPHAEWDSGKVGYIHMTKKQAMDELSIRSGSKWMPLTDETWRERVDQYLEAEVSEYDNYLTGEIYGYQLYVGLDEVDSCWGFNPGDGDIEALMKEELGSWFGPGMKFEYDSDLSFDIDDFYEAHGFPELRERIETAVLDCLSAIEGESGPYPFELSADAIRSNEDSVLTCIVEEIYDEHVEPTPERIREALDDHAGISREVKPKLTVQDLDPNRDYTIEELVSLAKEIVSKKSAMYPMPSKERKSTEFIR